MCHEKHGAELDLASLNVCQDFGLKTLEFRITLEFFVLEPLV